jgi:hypothetical protein
MVNMEPIDEILSFLNGLGTLGTLTKWNMPTNPNEIGTLYQYGGLAPDRKFGVIGIGYENISFQLVFRGEPLDGDGPAEKAAIALAALAEIGPGAISSDIDTEYLSIEPMQSRPFPVKEMDKNSRHYLGFNFYVKKAPSV